MTDIERDCDEQGIERPEKGYWQRRAEQYGRELHELTDRHERLMHDNNHATERWAHFEALYNEALAEVERLLAVGEAARAWDIAQAEEDRWPVGSEEWMVAGNNAQGAYLALRAALAALEGQEGR